MLILAKRWTLTRRALAVAAGAVGVTAVVIAAIFTFALLRASIEANADKNRSLAFSAMQIVEDELSRSASILRHAGMLLASGDGSTPDSVFETLHGDDPHLIWVALLSENGRLLAASSPHLYMHPDSFENLISLPRVQDFTAISIAGEHDPVLQHRSNATSRLAVQFSYLMSDGRILAASYDRSLVDAVRTHIMHVLHLDPDSCVELSGPGVPPQFCPRQGEQVAVTPADGFFMDRLGWRLALNLPSAAVRIPAYAFALTALGVGFGIAIAARGIGWASRPALQLADSASERKVLEGLLERGEVPPDLGDLARQLVSLHRVSESRMAHLEEMLGEAYRRFDDMTRNFPGVIFRRQRDENGLMRYSYVSPACQKYFGVSAEEVMRDADSSMRNFNLDDAQHIAGMVRDAPENQPLLFQYRVKGGDGRERWMQTSIQPFVTDMGLIIWEGVAVDVSAIKQAEARELEMRQKAVAENQAKSRFLAVMSHEIRNPLNSITGYARLIREHDAVTAELAEHARIIEQSSQYLKLLVNDVLDFSKAEAARLRLESKPFSLGEMADLLAD